jgi:hypothetical protein
MQRTVPFESVSVVEEIRMARCDVCRQHLWKETDDGEKDVRSASDRKAQEEKEGDDVGGRSQEGEPVRESEKHGLERGDMGGYRVKATQVDAEQVQRDVNVSTRRGLITARAGDWVIHDALGVAEVLDGKAFSERYEAVPAEEQVQGVGPGTPDPNTPKDAPRENVQFPEHMQDYLTGRSDEPPGDISRFADATSYADMEERAGRPGARDLTEEEAREAAKEPDEKPVVGSSAVLPSAEDPKQGAAEWGAPPVSPKNRGGRPKGSGKRGH